MRKKAASIGGMLLIAGSCIGAGMLALPIVTGLSGFFPSIAMFFCAWLFMTATALLLVEANGWFSRQVNLFTMTNHALGKWGKGICWMTYLFLFYALLVAYISGIGSLCETFFQNSFNVVLPFMDRQFGLCHPVRMDRLSGNEKRRPVQPGIDAGKDRFFYPARLRRDFLPQAGLLLRSDPIYAPSALPF